MQSQDATVSDKLWLYSSLPRHNPLDLTLMFMYIVCMWVGEVWDPSQCYECVSQMRQLYTFPPKVKQQEQAIRKYSHVDVTCVLMNWSNCKMLWKLAAVLYMHTIGEWLIIMTKHKGSCSESYYFLHAFTMHGVLAEMMIAIFTTWQLHSHSLDYWVVISQMNFKVCMLVCNIHTL